MSSKGQMNVFKTRRYWCFVLLVTCVLLGQAQGQGRPAAGQGQTQGQGPSKEELGQIITGIEKFSLHILRRSSINTGTHSVVLSPFSVWAMLTVLSEGARGLTLAELSRALRHPDRRAALPSVFQDLARQFTVRTPTVQLQTSNAVFVDFRSPIDNDFTKFIQNVYQTQVSSVDFQRPDTASTINRYISNATQGRITEIVSEDDLKNGQLIMTNAIFFKGQWKFPFNASLTKLENFHNEAGQPVGQVNMMYQRGPFPYVNMKKLQAHLLELPYGQEDRLSMLLMLPYASSPLKTIWDRFAQVQLSEVFAALSEAAEEYPDDEVDVYLPRFKVSSDIVMNKILNEMGIYEVFDPKHSDLSALSKRDQLYLSRIIHKAEIEVTEEGTTASAVTAGELSNRNTPPKFKVDRPFLFLIVERVTNVIVFGGTYEEPVLF